MNKLSEDPTVLPKEPETPESANSQQKLNFHNAAMLITRVLTQKNKVLSRKQRLIIKQNETFKKKIEDILILYAFIHENFFFSKKI